MAHARVPTYTDADIHLPAGTAARAVPLYLAGLVALGLAYFLGLGKNDGQLSFFHAYLMSFTYFTTVSLGALFFVVLQYLVGAQWSVLVRRSAEAIACNLVPLALLSVPVVYSVFVGGDSSQTGGRPLYAWTDKHVTDPNSPDFNRLVAGKQPYLNNVFFLCRTIVFFTVWTLLARYYYKESTDQDRTGDREHTGRMMWLAPLGVILFTFTITFFAFDYLMSLNPTWYSTIFGVYVFAGAMVSFFSLLALTIMTLQHFGYLRGLVNAEHFHDIGKFMFGFTFFWGYIAFSQYMLIWYGNIPEETEFFKDRQTGLWTYVSIALLVTHLLIPFPGLISRNVKRNRFGLAFWALWILAVHLLDHYWMVMPNLSKGLGRPGELPFGPIDLLCLVGFGAILLGSLVRTLASAPLIPTRDPFLKQSLTFKNY